MAFQFGELPFRGRPVPRSAAITTTATPSLDLSTTSLSSSTPAVPTKGTVQLAFSKPAADQRSALLSFPDEVKVRILSCVPIASIPTIWGATCQELHGLIADRKQHIIELITQRELARSGAQVNKIKDFQDSIRTGRPDSHDFIQLFRGLKIWTRLRGVTPGVRKTILSYVSWLEHLRPLQGPSEGRQRSSIQLSTAFLALKVYSRNKKSARYRRRISVFNHLLKSVPMSSAERDLWKKESKKTIEGQTRRQRNHVSGSRHARRVWATFQLSQQSGQERWVNATFR